MGESTIMNEKKNILFVMASMNRGGAERSLINLLKIMDRDKYDISLLIFDYSGKLISQIPPDVTLIYPDREMICVTASSKNILLRNFSLKALLYRMLFFFRKNRKAITYIQHQEKWKYVYLPVLETLQKEYDIAVAYMHSLPSYYVIDKVNAKRKILWVHNDYSRLAEGKQFDRFYFEKADQVVTISEQCVKELVNAFPDLSEKFICICNLNPEKEIREKANAYYPVEFKDYTGLKLVSVGRLNNQKGFDYAIKAAKILKDKGVDFVWYIIGSGELKQALTDQVRFLGVEKEVQLLGERENPYPYFKNADIVVQTSRYEGKSIVLDEAKILCKPIITTDYVSVSDQIENGKNGLIVALDERKIAEGILSLVRNPVLCENLIHSLQSTPDCTQRELEKYYSCFDG